MAIEARRSVRKPNGFGRVMVGLDEREAKETYASKLNERADGVMRLKEKYEKIDALALGKGKLDEMFEKNPRKAENLLMFLEATETSAKTNPTLMENQKRTEALREATQTSGFLGVTPQDIVKIARIAYPNSVAPEMFDFWGMSSMKDSIYKLETLIGSTARGSTANDVVYEKYGEGRYASEWEEETITAAVQKIFTDTLTNAPLRPYKVEVYLNDKQVGIDNGAGIISGAELDPAGTNTVNYTTGAITLTFLANLAVTDSLIVRYSYDSEQSTLFGNVGSVLLNLVVYDYRASPYPLAIEWTRFTEELMSSKLGMSAKESLIAGAADIFRKSMDEFCIDKAIKASNWTSAVTFDADFAAAGSDSSTDHAQGILSKIIEAEMKTYNALGRMADKSNVLADTNALIYLMKHKQFNSITPPSRIGIYKAGELAGRDVYVAPPNVITPVTGKGKAYIFGKGNDTMNVDSVVSVGTWKAGLTTDPVELKNFNSQMGMAFYGDIRTNNRQFATSMDIINFIG